MNQCIENMGLCLTAAVVIDWVSVFAERG